MKRLLLLVALVVPTSASAAKNPYTPTQVCGAGFAVIDSHAFGDPYFTLARTFLLYDAGSGRNCAVTMKRYDVGNASQLSVVLQRQGGKPRTDSGDFEYYAGPVYVKAAQTCVRWGGGAMAGIHSAGFMTDYEHCG